VPRAPIDLAAAIDFSTLEISSVSEDDGFTVVADLTILDQTHEITFPVTAVLTEAGLIAHAKFDIDRTRWGITFDSSSFVLNLGDRAIKDEISYQLDLVLEKE